jgi:formiminoglutamase
MSNQPITQSQKRFQESVGSLFVTVSDKARPICLFLKSSTDIGVVRNGGRNGAKYAPQSFLSVFKKLTHHSSLTIRQFAEAEVSNEELELKDFALAQQTEAKSISEAVEKFHPKAICHFGGGHDHIFPLLLALSQKTKHIVVLNIDAHADTRVDDHGHSGTPFRQFAENFSGDFHLFQAGLHPFANSESTLSPLKKGHMNVLWKQDLNDEEKWKTFFASIKKVLTPETILVFSLDADALSAALAPGVSAVNGSGLGREELTTLWKDFKNLTNTHPVLGIYEVNPQFDGLNMTTVRTLSTFVYETLMI